MSKIIDGEVEIDLGGENVTLSPTLGAATRIARHFGGFSAAHQKLQALDLDAFVTIIRWGSGLDDAGAKTLASRVFRAGLLDLVGPLSAYIVRLSNGGREIDPAPKNDEDADASEKNAH